ncbi:uncharacterized protein LOC1269161 [Anopheles gambiae]|nr:uncharacterized protein LOC1269161 [Anopheles gambiae]
MSPQAGRFLLLLVCVFCGVIGLSDALNLQDACETPDGKVGTCVYLRSCLSIRNVLLKKENMTPEDRSLVMKSKCGQEGRSVLVCCPLVRKLTGRFDAPVELPPPGECGKMQMDRIVGGEVAPIDGYPWLTRIQYYKGSNRYGFHCGGVLIHNQYVLTAAHCIEGVPSSWIVYQVRLGEFDTTTTIDCVEDDCADPVRDVPINAYVVHPDYYKQNGADYNDIALLQLSETVEFTDFIRPICLPTSEESRTVNLTGKYATVAGWGQTENSTSSTKKLHLRVPVVDNEVCADAFSSIRLEIIPTQLCAGGEKGKDSCRGDSGGPLMRYGDGRSSTKSWYLIGLVSFGLEQCGTDGVPGVYTRMSEYMDWVLDTMESVSGGRSADLSNRPSARDEMTAVRRHRGGGGSGGTFGRGVAVVPIITVIMCVLHSSAAQFPNPCRTPDLKNGLCVTVTQCPLIQRLLNQPLLTSNVVRFLEASRCGAQDRKVLVCCAEPENVQPATTAAPLPVQTRPPASTPLGNRLSYETQLRLLPDECGVQYTDRIIGGERAQLDEYPWTALIQHRRKNGELKFHCGGALISDRYVLTAAHCIENIQRSWTLTAVRLGEWDIDSDQDCANSYGERVCADPVQDIAIEKYIVHPGYAVQKQSVKNDIAQVRLARPAVFNDYVQPICLPLEPAQRTISYDGQRFVVAGWGQTEDAPRSRYKLYVGVSGVPEQTCQQQYPQAGIDLTQVCAGGTAKQDSCRGDSGGPLMYVGQRNSEGVMYLGGLVSYGRQCGLEGVPGVYTRVNQFVDWIVSNLEP